MRNLKQVVIEELKEYIVDPTKAISEYEDDVFNYNSGLKTAIQVVEELLTTDVVKVIRCRDCKWKEGSVCTRFADVLPFPDDYCSRGERKEVEDE